MSGPTKIIVDCLRKAVAQAEGEFLNAIIYHYSTLSAFNIWNKHHAMGILGQTSQNPYDPTLSRKQLDEAQVKRRETRAAYNLVIDTLAAKIDAQPSEAAKPK